MESFYRLYFLVLVLIGILVVQVHCEEKTFNADVFLTKINTCSLDECTAESPEQASSKDRVTQPQNKSFVPTFTGGGYFFPMVPVPRYKHDDPRVLERIGNQEPVILTGRPVFKTDSQWDMDYLRERLSGSDMPWYVAVSPERTFYDYNEDRNLANYKIKPPYKKITMTFSEFLDVYDELERADNGTHAYLRTYLYDSRMGDAVYRLDHDLLSEMSERFKWDEEHKHLMLISMRDSVTPLHFDHDENLFQQVFGYKRVIFFHSRHYKDTYPYPLHHARDRYSRVNMEAPDFDKFPGLLNLKGEEAVLGPGDVLYIPPFYPHHVETSHDGASYSIAFRYFPPQAEYMKTASHTLDVTAPIQRDGKVIYSGPIVYYDKTGERKEYQKPDTEGNQIHMLRHIENFIAEVTGSYRRVPDILRQILDNRFDGLEFSDEEPL